MSRPIVLLGAGGIVRDAHLPAYRRAGFSVAGLYDLDHRRALALARKFSIPQVPTTLAEAVALGRSLGAIFDVAVPASALGSVLRALPPGSPVLAQKPFGENLAQARRLLTLCQRRRYRAAVNFQLRFAPCVAAARKLIDAGAIGEVHDLEVRVTVFMPWRLWTFLEKSPRVEILYHSIHYIDLIRSFFGEPRGVYAKTVSDPASPKLASTRSAIILDYGPVRRATITTNHAHEFGRRHQESYVKWEGSRGALKAKLGLLLNYPKGEPDTLEVQRTASTRSRTWKKVPLTGNWYPDAFIGTMSGMMQWTAAGTPPPLLPVAADAVRTMAVVEAAYRSSARGATPIP